ncbi:HsdR family type I site-specific deoxyribonuclease [Gryllotalpicola daejeonensis]|uniref:Type I restriction enzyme endonuclease subunit n=1 Tax=Gryllotalpicola daejeonensis TaxID=993087 RepID=A0ABP7ZD01_9MICO
MGFSEKATVQAPLIAQLSKQGWEYIPGAQLSRDLKDAFIEPDLRDALVRFTPAFASETDRLDEAVRRVRQHIIGAAGSTGLFAANEELIAYLRGERSQLFAPPLLDQPLHFIDFENPGNNRLIVSDEVTYRSGAKDYRFDIVLWVNGVPLVVGETKTPVAQQTSWIDGARDIHDTYEPHAAAFFATNVFSFATDGLDFRYGAIGQPVKSWKQWGDTTEAPLPVGPDLVKQSAELLLAPETILEFLRRFTMFENRPGQQPRKLVPRYFQYETVNRIVSRVVDGSKHRGLIYHTQGAGKTLSMLWAAINLSNQAEALGRPTIVVVADRVQLVRQAFNQFNAAAMPTITEAQSASHLRSLLSPPAERGVIFTTVHKFKDAGELNQSDKIIVLVDEAHRTQEGLLGVHMRDALPKAFWFGFTGTPIANLNQNTYKLFGDPDDDGSALNTYNSDRSIHDGTTVPIKVSARSVESHLEKQQLDDAFDELAAEEQLDEDEKEVLTSKATRVETLLSNPKRIEHVCQDIVDHYYANVAPLGMKAQIVVGSRQLCALYYDKLTQLLEERAARLGETPDEAAVVMNVAEKGEEEWQRFHLNPVEEEQLLNRFRDFSDRLRFLIVTSKLGTGFDAPIEGVMYLDKPLKLHTLFQTITRTNRTWEHPVTGQSKAFGLVVDYIGLGDGFARAMVPADPDGKTQDFDIDHMLALFKEAFDALDVRFVGIDKQDSSADALTQALARIPEGPHRDKFQLEFRAAQALWEELWPTARQLAPYADDYRWLAQVFQASLPKGTPLDADLLDKTLALVHEHTVIDGIRNPRVSVQIAGPDTIRELIARGLLTTDSPIIEKTPDEIIDSIADRLRKRIDATGGHVVYRTLSERLERLRQAADERAQSSIEYLRELLEIARDLTAAEDAEEKSGAEGLDNLLNPDVGALTQIFVELETAETPAEIRPAVEEIDGIVRKKTFPGWQADGEASAKVLDVQRTLRRALKDHGFPVSGPLFDRAFEYIKQHY